MQNTTFPFIHPESIEELQAIIDQRITENIHLDYKASAALSDKGVDQLPKDISSFANSDGGTIIYGIEEENHLPTRLDDGIDHHRMTKERLEQIINSRIAPRPDGLRISQIHLNTERSYFVVSVPRSERGPHQERNSFCYYKRHNFKCSPMEDYEINDVRNRKTAVPSLISIRIDVVRNGLLELIIENIGTEIASDVSLSVQPALYWKHGEPQVFSKGIKHLPPHRKLGFLYGLGSNVLKPESPYTREFTVKAHYLHQGLQKHITDHFEIDLTSLNNTLLEKSDLEVQTDRIEKSINRLSTEIESIKNSLKELSSIAAPSGLLISVTTLRNMAHLLGTESKIEKIDANICSWKVFQEVLSVNSDTAIALRRHFQESSESTSLAQIKGMNAKLLEKIEKHFYTSEM